MIVPNVMVPSIQASTQHHVEAVAGVPTETSVIARIPYRAVPATVAQRALEQDMRNRVAYDHLGQAAASEISDDIAESAAGRAAAGFSTPFMAQWLSQASANDNRLIAAWLKVSRSGITPELMEEYSQVKYRPSNAGRPMPPPKGMTAILAATQQAVNQPSAIQAESGAAQEVAVQAGLFEQMMEAPVEQMQVTLGQELAAPLRQKSAQATRDATAQDDFFGERADTAPNPAPTPQIRYNTSLIRDRGFDAYVATFSRNMLNGEQGVYEPLQLTA